MTQPPREFTRIERYFRPLAGPAGLDLADDAALLAPPAGRELVLTADAMVENVHFIAGQPAGLIARKLLRVNLSDIAAKGATPLGYLLTMSIRRDTPEEWIADFTGGLRQDQEEFGMSLLGGDSTSIDGPMSLSVTMIGHVEAGRMVRRSGAKPGDGLWVTGTIGDGALGLAVAQNRLQADDAGFLYGRYCLPSPRLGLRLSDFASAAMDVSDGLIQDLGHLCRASHLGAVVETAAVPLSEAARAAGAAWQETCLTGGDDYELLMAVSPRNEAELHRAAAIAGVPVARIGRLTDQPHQIATYDEAGEPIVWAKGGWSHF